jgi:hypothetical protein
MEIQIQPTQKFQRGSLPGILEIARASIQPDFMENLHRLSDGATDAPVERRVIVVNAYSNMNKLNEKVFYIRSYDKDGISFTSHRAEALKFSDSDVVLSLLQLLSKHPSEVMKCWTVKRAESVTERNLTFRLSELEAAI